MSLNAYERETVINMCDGDDYAYVTTHQRAMITKLRKNKAAEELEIKHGVGDAIVFKLPAKLISIRNPRPKRVMTEEQRKATADRLAKARENK